MACLQGLCVLVLVLQLRDGHLDLEAPAGEELQLVEPEVLSDVLVEPGKRLVGEAEVVQRRIGRDTRFGLTTIFTSMGFSASPKTFPVSFASRSNQGRRAPQMS